MKALAWSARDGQIALLLLGSAALYVIVTVLAGIAAAWLGLAGVRALR